MFRFSSKMEMGRKLEGIESGSLKSFSGNADVPLFAQNLDSALRNINSYEEANKPLFEQCFAGLDAEAIAKEYEEKIESIRNKPDFDYDAPLYLQRELYKEGL